MPVVILIDEYDKPILDNIITDNETAIAMRDGLRDIYSVIKGLDEYIRFVFLTGVSKFSKMNLFSGLNNLRDITLSNEYGTICGYTQADLELVLKSLFSAIPYNAYVKNKIADYEGFYSSVIYAYFYSLGIAIHLEEASSRGRADMVVEFPDNTVYIFEFKVVEEDRVNRVNTKKPLEQIKEKRYFEKYFGVVEKIFLIGIEFSKEKRNLVGFEWEAMGSSI